VGLGVNLSRVRDRADARLYLDRFLAAHPDLGRGQVLQEIAGAVSVSTPLERTVTAGLMLAGDAARMIDPLTGGGIVNGCLAARIAGEVAGEAVAASDFGAAFLNRYERRWRERLEDDLYRNYLIKERLLGLDDERISRIVRALEDAGLREVSAAAVLEALRRKHPELLAEFDPR